MSGQTLTQVRQLLDEAGLTPRRQYGQNFLIDLNLMRKVIDAGDPRPEDTVLEVGPGTGSLTDALLARGASVVAVEIDHGLQALLRARYADQPRLALIAADVLAGKHAVAPEVFSALLARPPRPGGARKLIANLPYQVATPLLLNLLLDSADGADSGVPPELGPAAGVRFERLVCTIQKEVGEKFTSGVGSELYGPVAVLGQTLADITMITVLPPGAFWPAPKVDSVLLRMLPRSRIDIEDPRSFAGFVQRAFRQRRKVLRRFVRDSGVVDVDALWTALGLNPGARPEDLEPAAWRRLYSAWRASTPGPGVRP